MRHKAGKKKAHKFISISGDWCLVQQLRGIRQCQRQILQGKIVCSSCKFPWWEQRGKISWVKLRSLRRNFGIRNKLNIHPDKMKISVLYPRTSLLEPTYSNIQENTLFYIFNSFLLHFNVPMFLKELWVSAGLSPNKCADCMPHTSSGRIQR